jgi:hypothetical protein
MVLKIVKGQAKREFKVEVEVIGRKKILLLESVLRMLAGMPVIILHLKIVFVPCVVKNCNVIGYF